MIERITDFKYDNNLKQEILELVRPSYIDPSSLIDREFEYNDTIYLARDNAKDLIAFFMTGDKSFNNYKIIYMGLSAVRHEYKNSGIGKIVYLAQIEDSLLEQDKIKKQILCWATTATPSAFYSIHNLWDNASPTIDFKTNLKHTELAKQICNRQEYTFADYNPFVLKGVAKNTRYSIQERERINDFIRKKDFKLFKELNINEEQGDRLLMLFHLPTWEKFNSLKNK